MADDFVNGEKRDNTVMWASILTIIIMLLVVLIFYVGLLLRAEICTKCENKMV